MADQGILAYFPAEVEALAFAEAVRKATFSWVVDVVPAYASVAVFFDPDEIDFTVAVKRLEELSGSARAGEPTEGRLHKIPCCYELGLDLERVAEHTRRSPEEVICLHQDRPYRVCAIGFCPGFPYLGYLPPELSGVPRLAAPRVRVEPGSVGLTGRQTGIYTMERPGGWNIIGRTPLELVNLAKAYFPIRTGDQVQFEAIDLDEFKKLQGRRLAHN